MPSKRQTIALRLQEEAFAQVSRLAFHENRSLANMAEALILQALKVTPQPPKVVHRVASKSK